MELQQMDSYARLILLQGVRLQRGQGLVVQAQAEHARFAERLAEIAYAELGASEVELRFESENLARLRYQYEPVRHFARLPGFRMEGVMHYLRRGAALVTLLSADPGNLDGADPEKLRQATAAAARASREYQEYISGGRCRWCIAALPGARWAQRLFGEEADAVEQLWELILSCCRVEGEDACDAWERHMRALGERVRALNELGLRRLRFTAGTGTDFTVAPAWPDGWTGGRERCADGIWFSPNIPTEEVWTTPHRDSAEGRVVITRPLLTGGQRVEGLWLEFRRGVVTDWGCDSGRGAMENLLALAPSMRRLGEVALVDADNPVGRSGRLFAQTLYDENASCHIALGAGVAGVMGRERDGARRVNAAPGHVDLLFGADDLCCTGTRRDGSEVPLLARGRVLV